MPRCQACLFGNSVLGTPVTVCDTCEILVADTTRQGDAFGHSRRITHLHAAAAARCSASAVVVGHGAASMRMPVSMVAEAGWIKPPLAATISLCCRKHEAAAVIRCGLPRWEASTKRRDPGRQLRQEDGRYFGLTVLGVQVHRMLPLLVHGDSTKVSPPMAVLALLPKVAVILPPVTSTFAT